MGKRRKARECALQALYQLDLKSWEEGPDTRALLASVHRGKPLPPSYEEYAVRLVEGVRGRLAEIDALIAAASEGWDLSRMAAVDRNLVRLAVYEILGEPDVPAAVILDEAVVLAQRFGDKDSGRFVNGVLGRIAREQRQESSSEGGRT